MLVDERQNAVAWPNRLPGSGGMSTTRSTAPSLAYSHGTPQHSNPDNPGQITRGAATPESYYAHHVHAANKQSADWWKLSDRLTSLPAGNNVSLDFRNS